MSDPTQLFIEFGGMLTEDQRKLLVDQLKAHFIEGYPSPEKKDSEVDRYATLLTQDDKLGAAVRSAPELVPELLEHSLEWMEKGLQRIEYDAEEPFHDDNQLLDTAKKAPWQSFYKNLEKLGDYLKQKFSPKEVDVDFYQKKVDEFEEHSRLKSAIQKQTSKFKALEDITQGMDQLGLLDIQKAQTEVENFLKRNEFSREKIKQFAEKFQSHIKTSHSTAPPNPEKLRKSFLKDWDRALQLKKDKARLEAIDKAQKVYREQIYADIEKYLKLRDLFGPITGALGRGLDLSSGHWGSTGFEVLRKYSRLLEQDSTIKELSDLLGRMRQAEIELEEEAYQLSVKREKWVPDPRQPSEVVGIRESRDLSRLLPSEAALLADDDLEPLFLKKYAEGRLQTYHLEGKEKQSFEETEEATRQKAKPKKKGPFILCVDTSGSMHGAPEHVAKVLAFALLKIALREDRKAYMISFSTGIQTLELTNLQDSLDQLVHFLSMSFHGGTDANPALEEALRMLQKQSYEKADVVMVSDFVMARPGRRITQGMKKAREQGTQFISLTVSSTAYNQVTGVFDHNWIYDTSNPNSLKGTLRKLNERFT